MALFWILAFAIAWALTVPTALANLRFIAASPVPSGLGNLIGLAPVIAAFISAAFSGEAGVLARRTIRFRAPLWVWSLALATPLLWLFATIGIRRLAGAESIDVSVSPSLAVFALVWLVLAFGEEIGWRGYALPKLNAARGFWKASTMLGVVWAVWHYPKLLSSPYVDTLAGAAPLIGLFTLQIILANYFLCWLTLRAQVSVPVAAFFHAGFNTVATAYPLAGIDLYLTGVVGAFVLLLFLLVRRVEPERDA